MLRRNGPVSPEAGRESMMGKICEKIGLKPGVKERVIDGESGKLRE